MSSPERPHLNLFAVKVDGSDLPPAFFNVLAELEVEQSLHMPGMFTLRVAENITTSPAWEWADDSRFSIGKPVTVQVRDGASYVTLLEGEITSIELDIEEEAVPMLIVRGYDKSHRLHRGTRTRAFVQQTDSQIAQAIAGQAGLSLSADSTSVQHEHLFQVNQTDWEFLSERARRIGFVLRFADGKLRFEKPESNSGTSVQLELGNALLEFRPRFAASAQVNSVEVRGWDPQQKRPTVGTVTAASWTATATGLPKGATAAQQGFAAAKLVVTDQGVSKADEAQAIAGSTLKAIASVDMSGEGRCLGNPKVKPGVTVQVTGIGTRFSGNYTVTATRHTYTPEDGYLTEFTVDGMSSGTVASLLLADPRRPGRVPSRAAWPLAVGVVTNNKDDERGARVKVKFPWLSEELESGWAPVVSPMAGAGRGFITLPEVNDEVLVGFLDGDFNYPYVLGATWNGQDKAPLPTGKLVAADGKVVVRQFRTRAGHILSFDDTKGSEKIELIDQSGKNSIKIESASGKIAIEATGNVSISAGGKVAIEAKADAAVQGANVSVEAKGKLELKGAQVTINGSGQVKISAPAVQIN